MGTVYLDVTNEPDSLVLPRAPSVLYLIYSLEIVVQDSTSPCLLLTYPTYALEDGYIKECIWAPPFVTFDVTPHFFTHRDVGHIRTIYKKAQGEIKTEEEIRRRLYLLGAQGADYELVGEVLEYKSSPREPEKIKCYYIKRYAVTSLDALDFLNIIDPENLKGHYFLPLDKLSNVLVPCPPSPDTPSYYYRGKPLAHHLNTLLFNPPELRSMINRAIKRPERVFVYQERGLIFRFDISGYGHLCEYIRSNMGTFEISGVAVEEWFNGAIYKIFMDQLAQCGNVRVRLEGDGFVAALPEQFYPNERLEEAVRRVAGMLTEIRRGIARFNSALPNPELYIKGRAAVIIGDYRYGRVGELASDGAEFEGPGITAISRLESALKEYSRSLHNATLKQKEESETDKNIGAAMWEMPPNFIVSMDLYERVQNLLDELNIKFLSTQNIRIKEYQQPVAICHQEYKTGS